MDVDEWIDERLASGASRDEIVTELVEQGWSKTEARQRADAHHQAAAEASGGAARLPYLLSGAALVISLAALGIALTAPSVGEQSVIRYPVGGGGGPSGIPQNGTGDATPETISVEILGGELSPDPSTSYAVDSILRISNGDGEAYTVVSEGLGLDLAIAAGESIETQITEPGTYTVRVAETDSEITVRIAE